MDYEYITSSVEKLNSKHYNILMFSIEKMKNEKHKRSINYEKKRFPIHDQTAVSLVLLNGKCISFSTIWNRKNFWGPSVYRLLNRMWKDPLYRDTGCPDGISYALVSKKMLYAQLDFIKTFQFPYIAFLSREGDKRRYMKWLSEKLSVSINICKDLCLVCPDKTSDSCWQTVAFLKKSNDMTFPFKRKPFETNILNSWKIS